MLKNAAASKIGQRFISLLRTKFKKMVWFLAIWEELDGHCAFYTLPVDYVFWKKEISFIEKLVLNSNKFLNSKFHEMKMKCLSEIVQQK